MYALRLCLQSLPFILTLCVGGWWNVAFGQLQSDNFTIDSYVVGSHTGAYGTSTNYTTGYSVENFTYSPEDVAEEEEEGGGGGGSSSGSRRRTTDTSTGDSVLSPTTASPLGVGQPPSASVPAYVPPVASTYVPPMATVSDEVVSECLVFTPRTAATPAPPLLKDLVSYYKVLPNGSEVWVDVPQDAFAITADATLCIIVTATPLPSSQLPDASQNATLIGGEVYQVSVFDETKALITAYKKPLALTVNNTALSNIRGEMSAYAFDKMRSVWVKEETYLDGQNGVAVLLKQPSLTGFFYATGAPTELALYPEIARAEAVSAESVTPDPPPPTFVLSWWLGAIIAAGLFVLLLLIYIIKKLID